MKSFILSAGFLLAGFLAQAQITEQLTFSINDVEISQSNEYDIVRFAKASILVGEEHAGKPQLPVAHVNILLPKGATATSVNITTGQINQLTGNYDVYPAQPPYYPNFEEPPAFVEQDPAIYASGAPFPQDPLLGFSNHGYREYTYVGIDYIPFSYKPQSGELFLATNLTISVSYTINTGPSIFRPETAMDNWAYQTMKNTMKNHDDLDTFYPQSYARVTNPPSTSVPGEAYETTGLPSDYGSKVRYIIITNNTDLSGAQVGNFVQKFQEFANWKTQKGTPAKVVTVDAIRAEYEGNDVQEKIRNFIQEAYKKWGTEYVLLGGNASIIPVRSVHSGFIEYTDLYYSAIEDEGNGYDDWNLDGDDIWISRRSSRFYSGYCCWPCAG